MVQTPAESVIWYRPHQRHPLGHAALEAVNCGSLCGVAALVLEITGASAGGTARPGRDEGADTCPLDSGAGPLPGGPGAAAWTT